MPSRRDLLAGLAGMGAARADRAKSKRLLLDSRVVARAEGARLALGRAVKERRNPLFGEDRPWEVRFDNLYANVMYDGAARRFRCWYSPFIVDPSASGTPRAERATAPYRPRDREMGVCYAESSDGVRWHKPELGLVEFEGSTKNNLVVRGPHGAGVFRDTRDEAERRYKMFYSGRGMEARFSADGLRWSGPVSLAAINAAGDTHNNALWVPERGTYAGITRLWDRAARQRLVGRAESRDFREWSAAAEVLRADPAAPQRQTYAMPVFPYGGVYLGLLMMFDNSADMVDCELAWSADTVRWERVAPGEPLIARGAAGEYDCGCIYAAAYPILHDGELLLYYGGSNGKHTSWRDGFFCLARLRADGWAGYEPRERGGTGVVETSPVVFDTDLRVSADAAGGGSVRVRVADAPEVLGEVTGDVTGGPVRWQGPAPGRLGGKAVRLRFELRGARLYSFGFGA